VSTWGRSNPEIRTDEPQELRLERVGGRPGGWRVFTVGAAGLLVVGVLLLKPWANWPTQPIDSLPTFVAVAATPTPGPSPAPTIDPMVLAEGRRQCKSPVDWRMVTAETTATRQTRTMYAALPSFSSGPTDTALPLSHLYASSLRAVGVCVPRSANLVVAAQLARIVLWQVSDDGTVRQVPDPLVIDRPLYLAGEAYWAPPVGEGDTWPVGRYVFEIEPSDGGPSRWMGVEYTHVAETGAASVNLP
jgi:hypothetical protein